MLKSKTLLIKTKSKKILRIVREHYLRDDIETGLENNKLERIPSLKSELFPSEHYICPDTNVVLHQMDVLDHSSVKNVIILQTVLKEVRHRSSAIYKKLRSLIELPNKHFFVFSNELCKDTWEERKKGESSNDLNDRLIRVAATFYNQQLKERDQMCVLITNDKANKEKAVADGLDCVTAEEYFNSVVGFPELADKLAKNDETVEVNNKCSYHEHLKLSTLNIGIKSGKYHQGKLRISQDNYLEGRVSIDDEKEVLIQGRENLNRAVHEDIIAIEVFDQSRWSLPSDVVLDVTMQPGAEIKQNGEGPAAKKRRGGVPTGRVVGIIKRNWRPYCGILEQFNSAKSTRHLFTPAAKRIPRIQIETKQAEKLFGQRLLVAIDSWPRHSKYPHGHFVRALGEVGDKNTENEVILLEHDIAHEPFSQAVLNCLPSADWTIPETELKRRTDLRHLPVCSVDPPGCTDIDDCLHCCPREDGLLEVGVHIADVTYFIRPNTPLDKESSQRATTVYLCDKRIDMVPELLSSNLCSLRDDGDRLAFSCLWTMTEDAQIVSTKFCKSVIRSRSSMTYAQAQMLINDEKQTDDITKGLRNLNKLAKLLKSRRIEAGALSLASAEVRFHVDSETHDPIDLHTKEIRETNSMVEEFMLLANCSVARHIQSEFADCAVLRRHPEPPNSNFDVLINSAKARNIHLSTATSRDLALSLDALENTSSSHVATLLRILATRCMMQAVYFCSGLESDFRHYGLAAPIYTHFTSPIRRYSDIMVHRLLAASIDADRTFPQLLDKHAIHKVCANLNIRHRMAQYAQRASVALHTQIYFRGKTVDEEAYVIFARKNAVQVLITKYGLEGTVFLDRCSSSGERLDPAELHYDEERCLVSVRDVTLHVFDKVVVRISHDASNIQHQRINMHLISPFIRGVSVDVSQKS